MWAMALNERFHDTLQPLRLSPRLNRIVCLNRRQDTLQDE